MRRKPQGIGLLELSVAGIVVVLLAATIVQLVVTVGRQHRTSAKHQVAVQEAANVMEHLFAMPWDALTPEGGAAVAISPEARKSIPAAELTIDITQPEGETAVKQVVVRIQWADRRDRPERSVRLVAWRYRR